jgi:ADP-heptose:LPS heptosyltransferase
LASISAKEILERCLRGERPSALPLIDHPAALFGILAEGLGDRFEPGLCDAYAAIFSEVLSSVSELKAADLVARYNRVRRARRFEGTARKVFVLSRVTLGADVAITSVILDAAKRRFPDAQIFFAGGRKSWELFASDRRLRHLPVSYSRNATLRERVDILRGALFEPESIVIDPDSRLTQLGLLPVCPEENYYFFESRSYGADTSDYIGVLAKRWVHETFGIEDAKAYIAPEALSSQLSAFSVSFGVGENPAKRIPDPFEEQLLAALHRTGGPILVDKGAGGEEAERVERAIARSGAQVQTWDGAFAGFASMIAQSRLYIGYDSAGQHVAAACGVPLVTVFAGFPCERFLARWSPPSAAVVRVDVPDPEKVLAVAQALITRAGA